jgi:hypothetical protein
VPVQGPVANTGFEANAQGAYHTTVQWQVGVLAAAATVLALTSPTQRSRPTPPRRVSSLGGVPVTIRWWRTFFYRWRGRGLAPLFLVALTCYGAGPAMGMGVSRPGASTPR